jgi:serine/threonine protein kinase
MNGELPEETNKLDSTANTIESTMITKKISDIIGSTSDCEYQMNSTPIGEGAFAKVYLGTDKYGCKCAIKKININKLQQDRIEKFLLELKISKKLDHPNIVKCFKTLQTKRNWYVITEYCDSGTLKEFILNMSGLTPEKREEMSHEVLIQLKDALKYLKQNNLIHRDLKPVNILFSKDINEKFVLKLADFGFAKYFNEEHLTKDGYDTMTATFCGSPMYMAPELLLNSMYNIKADLWSFGVIMYEMITGNNPYNYPTSIPQLRELMISQKINYSMDVTDGCVNLLKSLLVIDPKTRISWDKFFKHNWFISGDDICDDDFEYDNDDDNIDDFEYDNADDNNVFNNSTPKYKTVSKPIPIPISKNAQCDEHEQPMSASFTTHELAKPLGMRRRRSTSMGSTPPTSGNIPSWDETDEGFNETDYVIIANTFCNSSTATNQRSIYDSSITGSVIKIVARTGQTIMSLLPMSKSY